MELRLAESPQDIIGLLDLEDDNVEDFIVGTKMEFIQFLVSQFSIEDSRVYVWIVKDDEEHYQGYLVIFDSRSPPLTNSFYIHYAYSSHGLSTEDKIEVFNTIRDWVKTFGVSRIEMMTKVPSLMKRYGFTEDVGAHYMVLEI